MDAQIGWDELGSPSKPGMYSFGSKLVRVRLLDIKIAGAALARGEFPVFNANWVDERDDPHYVLTDPA